MHIRGSSIYFTVVGLTSTTGVLAAVQPWGQCGGMGFTGETACAQGWGCKEFNPYYSQCIEGASDSTPSIVPSAAPAPSNNATSAPVQTAAPVETSAAAIPTSAAPVPSVNATTPVAIPTTFKTLIASSSSLVAVPEDASTSVVVVSTSVAAPSATPSAGAGNSTGTFANGEDCSLDAVFKAKGKKYIGVATDKGRLTTGDNAAIIKADFGQVTPENRYASLSSTIPQK